MNQVLRLVTSYGSPFRRLQLYKWEHRSYFLAVGGNTPFRRRYIAASAYWSAQVPARIRLNQARVTCFPPNPSVVSASFESSIFASASEQKSKEALSATMSLSFESVSFASATLGAGTAAALPHSRLFVSAMWTTRRPKVIWSALGL